MIRLTFDKLLTNSFLTLATVQHEVRMSLDFPLPENLASLQQFLSGYNLENLTISDEIKPNTLYFQPYEGGLKYSVITPSGQLQSAVIRKEELEFEIDDSFSAIDLRPILPELLKITSARGHTTATRSGDLYRQGVHKLVKRFKAWLETNDLLDEAAVLTLKKFLANFEYSGSSEHYSKTTYPFFTEGVITFAQIIEKIQKDETPLFFRKDTIKNLVPGMAVCAPGVHTNLVNADLRLSRDLPIELMGIRRNIAEQVALTIIRKHMPDFGNGDPHQHQPDEWEIAEGHEMHYANAILNLYNDILGITAIPDENAPQGLPDGFENEFNNEIKAALRPSAVIEAIMFSTDCWQQILQKKPNDVKPDNVDTIINWLNHYGNDSTFNFRNLFDYDEVSDEIRWCSNSMEYYFHQSLLRRLAQRGYINLNELQTKNLPDQEAKFYIPETGNITLAAVKESEDANDKPFVSYYIDLFCKGKNIDSLHALLTEEQLRDLRTLTIPQLEIIGRRIMRQSNPKEKENFLSAFIQYFPKNYLILIDILSAGDTDTKLHLAQRYPLIERIRADESFIGLIKYVALFPQERWQNLIMSSDLWGNSLLKQREDLQRLLRLLQKNNSLNSELLHLIATVPEKCKALIQAIEEISTLQPAIVNIITLRLLIKSYNDPIIVADSLKKLHALNPGFINKKTCHILQNYTESMLTLIKGLQNLNRISSSLLNVKLLQYIAAPTYRIALLVVCIETLYKTDATLLSDENLIFLFDKDNRSGLFAHILATWFKINPALIQESHRNILTEVCPDMRMTQLVSNLFDDILRTYPSLVTNNNLKRIILGAEKISLTLLELKKVNPALVTETILKELIDDPVNAANLLPNTINNYISAILKAAVPPISTDLLKEFETKFDSNEKIDIAMVIDRLHRASPGLINQENIELLVKHDLKIGNYNSADVLDKLYKIKPSLVNSSTFKAIIIADSPQLKHAISNMSSNINDDKNYQLLFAHPGYAVRLSKAMSILADTNPALLNDEMRLFLGKYSQSAFDFASVVVNLYTVSPSLVTTKNLNILGEASDQAPILARALMAFYKDNQNPLNDTQIALIQKNAVYIRAGLNHLAKVDQVFENKDNFKLLVSCGEHAESVGKALSQIYSNNLGHAGVIASAIKIIFKKNPEILTAENLLSSHPIRLLSFFSNVIKLKENNIANAVNINLLFKHADIDQLTKTLITLKKLSLTNEVNVVTLKELGIKVDTDAFRKLFTDHPKYARSIAYSLENHPRLEFVHNMFYMRLNAFITDHATLFSKKSEKFINCMLYLFAFSDQKNIAENPLTYFYDETSLPISGQPPRPYTFFCRESLPPTKTEILAAENMIQYLSGDSSVKFTPLQVQALKSDKLGKILSAYKDVVNVDQLPHYPSLSK